ncbi:MAG: NAD(P)-dependent glycerol-1-phosphate dehydrogenase [Nitrososphaera sp.]
MESSPVHLMELPRKILIGDGVVSQAGSFVRSIESGVRNIAIISGRTVKSRAGAQLEQSLASESLSCSWYIVTDASMDTVLKLREKIGDGNAPDIVIGFGGGRSVDIAKMTAFKISRPFVSVPTSASHDGISSPFVSVRGTDKPHSIKANTPIGVLADTTLLSQAPPRLLAGGCGDLVAKLTAVKDWELARDSVGEYFGSYAANLASMSAEIILDNADRIVDRQGFGIRTVVEALISAGVAACIAGSSRPCSGAEHLFSHALEYVVGAECGLHGERVGLGTIMMAKLHGLDWQKIVNALQKVGAPVRARDIGIGDEQVVKSLVAAQGLRPERYTILAREKIDSSAARQLAHSVGVI